jgi:predicted ferric reductase
MTNSRTGARHLATRIAFILLYFILVALPALLVFLIDPDQTRGTPLSRIGDTFILIVFPLLALQPVLAARLRVLDRTFGLDIVYLVHKTMGMTAGALLPGALVIRIASSGIAQAWLGIISAGVLIILMLTAFLYHELRMGYEAWRRLHNVLAIGVLTMVFVQALYTAPFSDGGTRQVLLLLYVAAGLAAYGHHRIIGPARRRKLLYSVASVLRETHNVWTLTFKAPEGAARFDYLPGQFQFLTFNRGRGEEHPFTISSSPTMPGMHTATIKESGDFTRRIGDVRTGDLIAVQAPFGRFSCALHPDEKDLVFISGGIGITPFMSMIRHMRDTAADTDVLLLYANNSEDDIVFRKELEGIASGRAPRLRVNHVLARPDEGWTGPRGRIDWQMIEKHVTGDLRSKVFYLCGPPLMMNALIAALIEHGVRSRQVRSERFAL